VEFLLAKLSGSSKVSPMGDFYNPYEAINQHGASLPHWQQGNAFIFVTWRLADSLPAGVREQLAAEKADWLDRNPQPWDAAQRREYRERFPLRIERWLDAGRGACHLRQAEPRRLLASSLRFFDEDRYRMAAFVIMPNHVHLLFQPLGLHELDAIVHSWKSYSARMINQSLNRTGPLWGDGYWDRLVRDSSHFERCRRYIVRNPIQAGLGKSGFTHFENEALIERVRRSALG
jgi:type I restriction enzyme R subunit